MRIPCRSAGRLGSCICSRHRSERSSISSTSCRLRARSSNAAQRMRSSRASNHVWILDGYVARNAYRRRLRQTDRSSSGSASSRGASMSWTSRPTASSITSPYRSGPSSLMTASKRTSTISISWQNMGAPHKQWGPTVYRRRC